MQTFGPRGRIPNHLPTIIWASCESRVRHHAGDVLVMEKSRSLPRPLMHHIGIELVEAGGRRPNLYSVNQRLRRVEPSLSKKGGCNRLVSPITWAHVRGRNREIGSREDGATPESAPSPAGASARIQSGSRPSAQFLLGLGKRHAFLDQEGPQPKRPPRRPRSARLLQPLNHVPVLFSRAYHSPTASRRRGRLQPPQAPVPQTLGVRESPPRRSWSAVASTDAGRRST